jgi:YkoY family integral membrane protein
MAVEIILKLCMSGRKNMIEQFLGDIFSFNTIGLLIALVLLEASLSVDNAVALASLVQEIDNRKHQQLALNWGLVFAFFLRVGLLLTATWVIQYWQFALLGALYLLWMVTRYFWEKFLEEEEKELSSFMPVWQQPNTLWQVVPLIAFTDLAFSLDSVTAAVAISDRTWLIISGIFFGAIALRFLAGLFLHWLEKFPYLQDAAYLTILMVSLRLLFKVISPEFEMPEWLTLSLMAGLFTWGFSKQTRLEVNMDS